MTHSDEMPPAKDPAPAVTRALAVLRLLEEALGAPLTLSEIARGLGAAKSSTSNVCAALEEGGMIRRCPGGYLLGMRTAELGGAYTAGFNQVREFFSVVESTPGLRREVVQVVMRDGDDALYLARHEGRVHRLGTPLGSRLPLIYSATGNAILSTLPSDELDRFLAGVSFVPSTDHSVRTEEEVRAKIVEASRRGYAIDREEAFTGLFGIAAPLQPWRPSDPDMAIGVALPVKEADDATIRRLGDAVVELTASLTNPFQRAVNGP